MRRVHVFAVAGVAIAAAMFVRAEQNTLPPAFPREGISKAFENDRVVVWQGLVGIKSRPTAMHHHVLDLVGVFIDPGLRTRTTSPDGKVVESPQPLPAGSVVFQKGGLTHSEEALVDGIRAVGIELKDRATSPAAAAPSSADRGGAPLALDNARVAAWEHRWPERPRPGAFAADPRPAVVVMIESGAVRAGGGAEERRTFGQVLYTTLAAIGAETASTGSPRALVVALK